MAEYLIQDSTLAAIADAIREKIGNNDPIKVAEYAAKIQSINSSDLDVSDKYLKYFSYQIDFNEKTIMLCSILYDVIYKDTGSYDVTIPDTIGGYSVIINCEEAN